MSLAIERIRPPSPEAFYRDYLLPRRPVILVGATDRWAARAWTPESLAARFGERWVTVEEGEDGQMQQRLGDYVEMLASHAEPLAPGEAPFPYLRGMMVAELFPELLDSFEILPYFLPNWFARRHMARFLELSLRYWVDMFIGAPGAGFPNLHYDTYKTHNWFCQIYGVKHFWAYPEWQRAFLYPHPRYQSDSRIRQMPPDPRKFPLSAHARPYEFDLHPGELLFIPAGLWHTTRMKTISISLSGNFVNATNFAEFVDEIGMHGDACGFDHLPSRRFQRYMRTTNLALDRLEGLPTRPFVYDKSPLLRDA